MKREFGWIAAFIVVFMIGGHFYMNSITTFKHTGDPILQTIRDDDQVAFFRELKIDVVDLEAATAYFEKTKQQDLDLLKERMLEVEQIVYETDRPALVEHEDGSQQFLLFPKTWLWFYHSIDVQAPISVRETIEQATFEDKAKRK